MDAAIGSKRTDIQLTKKRIRTTILLRLKNQKEEDRYKKSELIRKKLFLTRVFKKAQYVMMYMSFGAEVTTAHMITEAQKLGKTVLVPVCGKNRTLRPCILKETAALQRGPYGIWEPAVKKALSLKHVDLVLVPGLAFDAQGRRLGRGKGYYDRFLKRLPGHSVSIGLAFDFQILPVVPTTPDDRAVDRVIVA